MIRPKHDSNRDQVSESELLEEQQDYVPLKERLSAVPAAYAVLLPLMLVVVVVLLIMLVLINLIP
jgi:hypothetical protein